MLIITGVRHKLKVNKLNIMEGISARHSARTWDITKKDGQFHRVTLLMAAVKSGKIT
jgi:hypothetical protein